MASDSLVIPVTAWYQRPFGSDLRFPLATCRSYVNIGENGCNDFRQELYLQSRSRTSRKSDAEAEAKAGRVHGGNRCSYFGGRCSEASAVGKVLAITVVANSTCPCFYVRDKRRSQGGNAEAEAEAETQKASNKKQTQMPTHSRTYVNIHAREIGFSCREPFLTHLGKLSKQVKHTAPSFWFFIVGGHVRQFLRKGGS